MSIAQAPTRIFFRVSSLRSLALIRDLSAANLLLQEELFLTAELLQIRFALGETVLQFGLTFVEFVEFFLRVADHAYMLPCSFVAGNGKWPVRKRPER